jgi:hypothetical protein
MKKKGQCKEHGLYHVYRVPTMQTDGRQRKSSVILKLQSLLQRCNYMENLTRTVGKRPPHHGIIRKGSIGALIEKGHESWSLVHHEGPPPIGQIFTRALKPSQPLHEDPPHRPVHLVCT